VIETDTSDFVIHTVFFQVIDGQLHLSSTTVKPWTTPPIIYHCQTMDKAKIKYEIHDKEILPDIFEFKELRYLLEVAADPISVYTNYRNIENISKTKIMNRRDVWWVQRQAGYDFKIL
jgi:hypothetical protein